MTSAEVLIQRIHVLQSNPCFAGLTAWEAKTLADLMEPAHFEKGHLIVAEGSAIDRIYFINTGQAEVSHQIHIKKKFTLKQVTEILAILGPGDTIGLNDHGFYSTTGQRTATIIALTECDALSIEIHTLNNFLHAHPHLLQSMQHQAPAIMRIYMIKHSLPFVRLTPERTQWLAEQVEVMKVKAGETIFLQGEAGDKCYLIQSGHVEIYTHEDDGSEKSLAKLKESILFGEATMMTRAPRNASARAIDNCTLLILEHRYLYELIENDDQIAKMFMTLMIDRSRPERNPRVSIHPRKAADGEAIYILKNPDNGTYFKLSEQGKFIWEQLNGHHTMQAITMALANEGGIFAPDVVAGLISKLAKAGFVTNVNLQHRHAPKAHQTKFTRCVGLLQKCLDIRYAFGDADTWLTRTYQTVVHYFFTPYAKMVLALIAISGLLVFGFSTSSTVDTFKIMPNVWVILVLLLPFTVVSVILHELAHAFATKASGHEVHYMGVGWFWFGPVAFTDTSDMWLSSKGPRIKVNMAGVYMDVIVAGISSLSLLVIDNPYIQAFFWLFALFTYLNAFRMLSPLQELDGYYVLMDLLDKPHLRQASITWLAKHFIGCVKEPHLFKKYRAEVWYWIACIVFLILVSLVTLFVQGFVFNILGMHRNPYLGLILPFIVIIVSCFGVIKEIRQK